MSNKFCILILFLCFFTFVRAQDYQGKIQELKAQLVETSDTKDKAKILSNISMQYFMQQIYFDSAFYYAQKSRDLSKKNGFSAIESMAVFNMGLINSSLENHQKAIDLFNESLKIDTTNSKLNLDKITGTLNNIGGSYFELAEYDKALEYYNESLELAVQQDDDFSLCIAYMNIGETQYIKGDLQEAKTTFEKTISILELIGETPPTAYLFYARTLVALGEVEKAKEIALLANGYARDQKNLKYTAETYQLLSNIEEKEENFKEAFKYFKQYSELNIKLNEAKQNNEIEKLKINTALKASNETIDDLSKKNTYLTTIYLLAVIGVLLLVLLVFRQRKVVKMTKNIHDVQTRLVASQLEKRESRNSSKSLEAAKAQDKEL